MEKKNCGMEKVVMLLSESSKSGEELRVATGLCGSSIYKILRKLVEGKKVVEVVSENDKTKKYSIIQSA